MNFHFQYPQALWLLGGLLLIFLLFAGYLRWRRKAVKKAGDPALVASMSPSFAKRRSLIKFGMLFLAFTLGCIAVANPRRPDAASSETRNGIDIVIALDVSNSMKATDIAPDRLSRARQFISKLIDNLENDRIGLVIFAGNAYVQMPLTFDREAARMYASAVHPDNISAQGTSIGDAFEKSKILFGEESERFSSIVLITDGETHDENALDAAKEMVERGVMIHTIGIGSVTGTTLIDSSGNTKKDENGEVVISRLNEEILKEIARLTNGTYIHLQQADEAVKEVMAQYAQIEKKALGDTSLMNFESFYSWFALPMLLLMAAEVFIPDRKKIKK